MIENWKTFRDQGKSFDAFLTDLSKAFDSILHSTLIAKLNIYGYDELLLQIMQSCLINRQQKAKVNN